MLLTDKNRIQNWLLSTIAIIIAATSLIVSHSLVIDLQHEERERVSIWAEAMRSLNDADESTDLTLVLRVIDSNNTIPVIVVDSKGNIQTTRNADESDISDMQREGNVIRVDLADGDFINVFYAESTMIQRLTRYPYIQLIVAASFMFVCILALIASKRAEQNKVWVGLSKETAHQLGTPISSLMAWVEVLRETYPDDELIPELDQDIKRLQMIAERFSKIGSEPELKAGDLREVIQHVVTYIRKRTSHKVTITTDIPDKEIIVNINAPLFEWVVENISKNAVDAMSGSGKLHLSTFAENNLAVIEITDTGCGIPKSKFESVFSPGYTTKKRGWGLGLSLARRIVHEHHHGQVYVKGSQIGKGTTFRIELRLKGTEQTQKA